jgi:hypothetical protein
MRGITEATPTPAADSPAAIVLQSRAGRDPLANPWLSRALVERYLIFDACVGGTRRVDLHPLVLSQRLHEAAVEAATSIYGAISRVANRAHRDATEQARYGLHKEVCQLARTSFDAGDDAALVRLDLLLGTDGLWHACEINADCPGGHNEATGLPELAQNAGFWEGLNPTWLLDALADRLAALAKRPGPGSGAVALIYATAYAEDLQICALIRRALRARGVTAVLCSPTAPSLKDGVLHIGATPIAVLYRFYPTEYMEGQRNLDAISTAIANGSLKTLSSFAHIYAQSKLAFARAFAHADFSDAEGALSSADKLALTRHVPETLELSALPRAELAAQRPLWVLKRALGRVGDEVFVGELLSDEDWLKLLDTVSAAVTLRGERWIAQRYIPQQHIMTPFGPRLVTLGVYLLDGKFVGYFARMTPQSHVSHDALCLPVFTQMEVR